MILISKNFISIVQNIEDYKDIGAEGPYKKNLLIHYQKDNPLNVEAMFVTPTRVQTILTVFYTFKFSLQ